MKPTRNKNLATTALTGLFATISALAPAQAQESKEPNLLYIFPDQYRLHALGIWSNPEYREYLSTVADPVKTPNIDRLAKSGVLFTQACSMYPLSSPHRGMLMSGIYSAFNGLDNNARVGRDSGLNHEIVGFTNVLKNAGYETAYVGKVHWERNEPLFDEKDNYIGTTEAPGGHSMNYYDTYVPEGKGRFGNDMWFQQLKGIHFNASSFSNVPEFVGGNKDGDPFYPNEFATITEANVILKYLDNEGGKYRNEESPFSIIWSINPPHNPYSKITDCEPEVYKDFINLTTDDLLLRENVIFKDEADKERLRQTAGIYFSLIGSVDREIGRVLDKLEEIGCAENTVIVFTADHGEMMGSHGLMGKPQVYDEAFLVPFIVSYPGVLEHRVEDLKINTIDIMPTMLGLMGLGADIPETVDGRDYSQGLISNDYGKQKPISALYRVANARGVRTDRYTYHVTAKGEYQIYDLVRDPYQMRALTFDQISKKDAKLLKSELAYWLKDARDSWYEQRLNSELISY